MIIYFVLNSLFTITTGIENIFLYCDDNRNECAYAWIFLHVYFIHVQCSHGAKTFLSWKWR